MFKCELMILPYFLMHYPNELVNMSFSTIFQALNLLSLKNRLKTGYSGAIQEYLFMLQTKGSAVMYRANYISFILSASFMWFLIKPRLTAPLFAILAGQS